VGWNGGPWARARQPLKLACWELALALDAGSKVAAHES
jgi:hypothetical protein